MRPDPLVHSPDCVDWVAYIHCAPAQYPHLGDKTGEKCPCDSDIAVCMEAFLSNRIANLKVALSFLQEQGSTRDPPESPVEKEPVTKCNSHVGQTVVAMIQ